MAQNDNIQFPVSLSSFEAGVSNNTTKLKWKTVCYLAYANFQIQSSTDALSFTTLSSFTADRLRCLQPFEFLDNTTYSSGIVYYRINAGDIDGNFYHSKIVKLSNKQPDVAIISVYPTVVNSTANIVFSSPYDNSLNIGITNSSGRLIKKSNNNISKGVINYNLDFNGLSNGVYWINVLDKKGTRRLISVVKR
jgi:hypothetical protein